MSDNSGRVDFTRCRAGPMGGGHGEGMKEIHPGVKWFHNGTASAAAGLSNGEVICVVPRP